MKYLLALVLLVLSFALVVDSYKYMLALNKCNENSDFTIHGLWPDYKDGTYPQYCNNSSKLNFDNIKDLLPQIRKYWITCPQYNNSEKWFLEHEWSKHGTCTPFTQSQYFSTALALYQMLPWRLICFGGISSCLINIIGIA